MRSQRLRWHGLALGGLAAMMTLAACGGTDSATPTSGASTTVQASASTAGSSSATPAPGIPSDAPSTPQEALASAQRLALAASDYPGGDWAAGGSAGPDSFSQTVCGAPTEPVPPVSAFAYRWVRPNGLTVFQDIRPVGAAQALRTTKALRAALVGCTHDQRTVSGHARAYDIAVVPTSDPSAVAYRRSPAGQKQGVWAFTVYLPARDCLVAFTTYSTAPTPPTSFLDALVSAERRKAG